MLGQKVTRGLVTVQATAEGRWQWIEDADGALWAELDCPLTLSGVPDALRASVQDAYEWATSENRAMLEEAREEARLGVDWNQWWWEQTRGLENMNKGRF